MQTKPLTPSLPLQICSPRIIGNAKEESKWKRMNFNAIWMKCTNTRGIFWDRYNEKDKVREELSNIQKELERVTKPCFEEHNENLHHFHKKVVC